MNIHTNITLVDAPTFTKRERLKAFLNAPVSPNESTLARIIILLGVVIVLAVTLVSQSHRMQTVKTELDAREALIGSLVELTTSAGDEKVYAAAQADLDGSTRKGSKTGADITIKVCDGDLVAFATNTNIVGGTYSHGTYLRYDTGANKKAVKSISC